MRVLVWNQSYLGAGKGVGDNGVITGDFFITLEEVGTERLELDLLSVDSLSLVDARKDYFVSMKIMIKIFIMFLNNIM